MIKIGCNVDYSIDVWSTACTIYEMYTGKLLFTGRNNNEMLKQMMQIKGHFVSKVLRKAEFARQFFDLNNNTFLSEEIDPITKQVFSFVKFCRKLSKGFLLERSRIRIWVGFWGCRKKGRIKI